MTFKMAAEIYKRAVLFQVGTMCSNTTEGILAVVVIAKHPIIKPVTATLGQLLNVTDLGIAVPAE